LGYAFLVQDLLIAKGLCRDTDGQRLSVAEFGYTIAKPQSEVDLNFTYSVLIF
jgi:hypothetical protein